MNAREFELKHSAGTYQKRDINIVRGEGVWLYDDTGKTYLDCIAGIGTAVLGHAHPRLVEAISSQAGTLMSLPELLCNPLRASYQEKILGTFSAGFDRVFFCNSGTEAVEAALKFARLTTGKHGIVALRRGYHGKTMGALSVTAEEKYREPFAPLLPGVEHVSTLKLEDLVSVFKRAQSGEIPPVGCFIFEPVQGESGVLPLNDDFIRRAVELAREAGALIIADEIQTGFGRTGKMWGHQHFGVEPDLVCMAKAIAGGVPMGAVAIGERIAPLPPRSHTSTFGGNPLACRAALSVLAAIKDEDLVNNAHLMGELIRNELTDAKLSPVREVRGKGLMIGIELKEHAAPYVESCANEGLLCLLAGQRVIRLLPPLIINRDESLQVVRTLIKVLAKNG